MAEQEDKKCCTGSMMKSGSKIVLGVALIILGLWAVLAWFSSLLMVIKGCIGLFLVMAGAITIAIAKE
ncbi:MAG: hypothetical protein KBB01_07075 [Candidatus Omnitrophica bacterium]|jgi:hypothetical protein|nr:hypothetical protein [Candidatus Omnitrophota bacterium]